MWHVLMFVHLALKDLNVGCAAIVLVTLRAYSPNHVTYQIGSFWLHIFF